MELTSAQQLKMIDFVRDISISDGVIQKREVSFLQLLMKAIDLPTRNIKSELINRAHSNNIELKEITKIDIGDDNDFPEGYIEANGVLDQLFDEFDNF